MVHLNKIEKRLIEKEYHLLKDSSLKDENDHDLFSSEKLYLLKYSSGKNKAIITIGQIIKNWYGYTFYENNGQSFLLNLNLEEKNDSGIIIEEIYEIEIFDDSKSKEQEIFII